MLGRTVGLDWPTLCGLGVIFHVPKGAYSGTLVFRPPSIRVSKRGDPVQPSRSWLGHLQSVATVTTIGLLGFPFL